MLKRPFLTRLASYSQHGFDTNLSHPILRIKLNAQNSCVPRDQSHTQADKLHKVSSWYLLHQDSIL